MKKIELPSGKHVKVDEWWEPALKTHGWYLHKNEGGNIYVRRHAQINYNRYDMYLHRLISGLPAPIRIIHKNKDVLDFRIENLEYWHDKEQIKNWQSKIDWKYGVGEGRHKDLKWDGYYGMWRVQFYSTLVGYYTTEYEGIVARNDVADELHIARERITLPVIIENAR